MVILWLFWLKHLRPWAVDDCSHGLTAPEAESSGVIANVTSWLGVWFPWSSRWSWVGCRITFTSIFEKKRVNACRFRCLMICLKIMAPVACWYRQKAPTRSISSDCWCGLSYAMHQLLNDKLVFRGYYGAVCGVGDVLGFLIHGDHRLGNPAGSCPIRKVCEARSADSLYSQWRRVWQLNYPLFSDISWDSCICSAFFGLFRVTLCTKYIYFVVLDSVIILLAWRWLSGTSGNCVCENV